MRPTRRLHNLIEECTAHRQLSSQGLNASRSVQRELARYNEQPTNSWRDEGEGVKRKLSQTTHILPQSHGTRSTGDSITSNIADYTSTIAVTASDW